MKYVLPSVRTDRWPELYIDFSKLVMGWGDLEPVGLPTVVTMPGELHYYWLNNSGEVNAKPDDVVSLIAYCGVLGKFRFTLIKPKRGERKGVLEVEVLRGIRRRLWWG